MSTKRERALAALTEADAEDALIAAKAAYRADPTAKTLEAKEAAGLKVRAAHNQSRAGRTGVGIKAG